MGLLHVTKVAGTFFLCPERVTAQLFAKERHAVGRYEPLSAKHTAAISNAGADWFLLLMEAIGAANMHCAMSSCSCLASQMIT